MFRKISHYATTQLHWDKSIVRNFFCEWLNAAEQAQLHTHTRDYPPREAARKMFLLDWPNWEQCCREAIFCSSRIAEIDFSQCETRDFSAWGCQNISFITHTWNSLHTPTSVCNFADRLLETTCAHFKWKTDKASCSDYTLFGKLHLQVAFT